MDNFFAILKKSLVATVFVIFAFVGTYVPHGFNKIEEAEAVWATLPLQVTALVEQAGTNIATTLSAAYNAITSFASDNLYIKEYVLDGIAWALAKAIIQSMVQSLVSWINSGFNGSPAFVQDLQGFLRNAADSALGEYLGEITGLGSFICSPFRLDIGIAIAQQYQLSRVNQPAPTCTLTGIIDNIEGFTSGAQGSFGQGGWDDWFDITSKPEVYTPYGAYLSAKAGGQARIINAKGEELSILNFGDGFLSGEVCQTVSGSTKQDCFISKPGKIIQEALTFNLDSGRQSLVSADEIDEVIAALLGQLANTAITGAAGLLGLGGGNGSVTGARNSSFDYSISNTGTISQVPGTPSYNSGSGGSVVNNDPGSGLWIPPNTSDRVIADQGGASGSLRTFVPGCINGGEIISHSGSGCGGNAYYSGTITGTSQTTTFSFGSGKILGLRYVSKPSAGNTVKSFTFSSGDGGNTGQMDVWLSESPTATYADTSSACKNTSTMQPLVITGPGYCPIKPNTRYYLFMSTDRNGTIPGFCGPCFRYKVDESVSDFL